jgi:hypothetical protein
LRKPFAWCVVGKVLRSLHFYGTTIERHALPAVGLEEIRRGLVRADPSRALRATGRRG